MNTILIIDDEADVRDYISETVNLTGYPTLKVDPKNEDVLAVIHKVRPAIVITENSAELLRLGANVVIAKPINSAELENQIKLCVNEQKVG